MLQYEFESLTMRYNVAITIMTLAPHCHIAATNQDNEHNCVDQLCSLIAALHCMINL